MFARWQCQRATRRGLPFHDAPRSRKKKKKKREKKIRSELPERVENAELCGILAPEGRSGEGEKEGGRKKKP